MTAIKIKENLHTIIDNPEDDRILRLVNEVVNQIIEDKKLMWDSLSEAEKNQF